MSVPPDLLKDAAETYQLELLLNGGLSSDALEKGIEAALERHERNVRERVATEIETYAHGLEANDAELPNDEWGVGARCMRWFADRLRTELGPEPDYTPKAGDIVEITLTGAVITWEDPETGEPLDVWTIFDDATGDEYEFGGHPQRKARVRVLTRGTEVA